MAHDLYSFVEYSVLVVRNVAGAYRPAAAAEVLHAVQTLLWQQMRGCKILSSPHIGRDFLRVPLGALEHDVFAMLMLDAQRGLVEHIALLRGMVSQTAVYPRKVGNAWRAMHLGHATAPVL